MDLPPSGWYPDPYGTPLLLRWWDGSGWTQHTHPDVTAGAGGSGGEPAATTVLANTVLANTAVHSTAVQATAVQATAVQAAAVAATGTSVQETMVQAPGLASTGLASTGLATTGQQPSAERLSRTKPPTGRPTAPQPALPEYPGAATAYQPATAYQQTTVHPGTGQPGTVQPGYPQPGLAGQAGGDGAGTQVLFLGGDAWQPPGGPPGGPGHANPYGYLEAQRKRRRRVIIGLSAGTAVAVAAIVIIATTLGGSSSTQVADQAPATPAASLAASAPSPSASPSASPSPTGTATGSLLTDGQAGLSYAQLPAPWQGASCPPSIANNGAFPWTAGESAVAGQVSNGQTTWYGEACSGLLPQQYGYSGVANLQSTAENLAQTFSNAYYGTLNHTVNSGQDAPVQVSGHAAWQVSYDVAYTDAAAQGATWNDEQATVVVVDNGTSQPAVFFTSIPDTATLNAANVTTLVSSLQLAAPAAGQTDTATAAPADGSQGGGGNGGNGDGGNGDGGGGGSNP